MTILNARRSDDAAVNGRKLEPAEALVDTGPRFPAVLVQPDGEPTEERVVNGSLLVDTGASVTCVDQSAANRAGLQMVDSGPILTATHENEIVPIYVGVIEVPGSNLTFNCNRAYGINLGQSGVIGVIGRDILKRCVLIYNGPDGSYSLSI